MKNFAFRCDASYCLGYGHLKRCISLATQLKLLDINCVFITNTDAESLLSLILKHGFGLYPLNSELLSSSSSSFYGDAARTAKYLQEHKTDAVIVDHYFLDLRWEQIVSCHVDRLIVIDDLANRQHDCDVLLDQSVGRQTHHYQDLVPAHAKLLLGPSYSLVDTTFTRLRSTSLARRAENQYSIKTLVICFGGGSHTHLNLEILDRLHQSTLLSRLKIFIIDPGLADRSDLLESYPSLSINVYHFIHDIATLFCESDLMIGAPGGTSWERCCLGLPSILLQLADNQELNKKSLQDSRAAICFDHALDFLEDVCPLIEYLCSNPATVRQMVESAASMIDGLGVKRSASEICA